MKIFLALSLLLTSLNSFAGWRRDSWQILKEYRNECSSTQVIVEEIVKNDHIKGVIKGLPVDAYEKFKVLFYVKTNRWYVHPYTYQEGQESGYSYSNLNANGEFWVKTVRRDVASEKLAVVLVPKTQRIAQQRWFYRSLFGIFGGVLENRCAHTVVEGNGDFLIQR